MATYIVRLADGKELSLTGTDATCRNAGGKPTLQILDGDKLVAQFERDKIAGWWDEAKVAEDADPVPTQYEDYDPFDRS